MPMFYTYFSYPLVVLLNILPPLLLTLLLYSLSGRAWLGFAVPAILVLSLSVISYFKMQIRNEPLIFSDFQLAGEAGGMAAGYTIVVNWKVWAAAFYLAAGTAASAWLLRYKPRVITRVAGAIAAVIAGVLLYGFVYTSDTVYTSARQDDNTSLWSHAQQYITRGFVFPFIHSFYNAGIAQPEGYTADSAASALAAYEDEAIPDDKKVNIISVMLEAYADLSVYDAIDFNVDVYGPLHSVQKESVSGSLVVNTFAGGTINTERSYLTGYTALDDFMQPVNSYITYLNGQAYQTVGFHAGDGWFYDRNAVNRNLGFDRYYFLEDYPDADRTDTYFFSKVLAMFEARDPAVPYFSYNLTFQNHGPYDSTITSDTAYIKQSGLTDASYNILNNYLEGIADTTARIAAFIDEFRSKNEPVVIVIFGDHKPWLGGGCEVYSELGINIDLSTEEGFYNFYTTPYLIWANDAAKTVLGNDFLGDGGDFSPCFLMNKVFELCGWSGSGYMKAANSLRIETPVVNTATGYFSENGVLTAKLSDEADTVYKNFKKIEYYWQHNF